MASAGIQGYAKTDDPAKHATRDGGILDALGIKQKPMNGSGSGSATHEAKSGIPEYPVTLQHPPPKDLDKYLPNPGAVGPAGCGGSWRLTCVCIGAVTDLTFICRQAHRGRWHPQVFGVHVPHTAMRHSADCRPYDH